MRALSRVESALASRWAPLLVGLAWAGVICWVWGGMHAPPIFHDELSYVFQAKLFASGRWTAPSPPMPDVFAQPHILVVPAMASKYPPGHALLLSLGELLGAPALVVLALVTLRIAVAFALARHLAGGGVALLTCVLLLGGDSLRWSASYFSENTTAAMLVVAWYALYRWAGSRGQSNEERGTRKAEALRASCHPEPKAKDLHAAVEQPVQILRFAQDDKKPRAGAIPRSSFLVRRHWFLALAFAVGYAAITRPYSALLFAMPIAWVVLRDVRRAREWRHLALGVALGAAMLTVLPLWSARTTGDWTLWPQTLYTHDYMPYDRPHFGVVAAQPRRELPVDLAIITPSLRQEEQLHTVAMLPRIALARGVYYLQATWEWPLVALALAIVGVAVAPRAAWVGIATVATVFTGYLAHVVWPDWTIYYMEVAPVLAFLVACGLAYVCTFAAALARLGPTERAVPVASLALLLVCPLMLPSVVRQASAARGERERREHYVERFRDMLARLPAPSVLFVRYSPRHSAHLSLITNGPDWPQAPVWVVPDRGRARNALFLAQATGRRGLFFDEERSMFAPYLTPEMR